MPTSAGRAPPAGVLPRDPSQQDVMPMRGSGRPYADARERQSSPPGDDAPKQATETVVPSRAPAPAEPLEIPERPDVPEVGAATARGAGAGAAVPTEATADSGVDADSGVEDAPEPLDPPEPDEGAVIEVIRPAAVVPERAARSILAELSFGDVSRGGLWQSTTSFWSRYDRPWQNTPASTGAQLMGTIQVAYGTPTRYEITIYRVTVTRAGQDAGWSVELLTDEALGFGGLTLAECPRAALGGVPRPFRY